MRIAWIVLNILGLTMMVSGAILHYHCHTGYGWLMVTGAICSIISSFLKMSIFGKM